MVCERNLLGKPVWISPALDKGKPIRGVVKRDVLLKERHRKVVKVRKESLEGEKYMKREKSRKGSTGKTSNNF